MEEKLWKTYSRSFVCLDINILSSVSITLPVPHGKVLLQDLVFRLSDADRQVFHHCSLTTGYLNKSIVSPSTITVMIFYVLHTYLNNLDVMRLSNVLYGSKNEPRKCMNNSTSLSHNILLSTNSTRLSAVDAVVTTVGALPY